MNAPEPMTHCPSEETLAAFIDGRLEPEARRKVMEHMATCADCRDVVLVAGEYEAADVVQFAIASRSRWNPMLNVFAALAAAIVVVAALPSVLEWLNYRRTGGLSMVIEAYDTTSERKVQARLSGGFSHKALKRTPRSNEAEPAGDREAWPLFAAVARLDEADGTDWKELRALGSAQLLVGDRDKAIETFERAVALSTTPDARLVNDLAAAYLERARRSRNAGDAARALTLANQAWQLSKTPESAWNRALAYEINGLETQAESVWQDYLRLDSSSSWATEVREEHLMAPQ